MEAENISNLNTSILQSAVQAAQTKDNLPLSLVENVSEIIVEDSYPEEASADVIVDTTDDKDSSKKPMTSINGSLMTQCSLNISKVSNFFLILLHLFSMAFLQNNSQKPKATYKLHLVKQ